jgi:putative tryptophan/tyrosine transport system substrate-binding protein
MQFDQLKQREFSTLLGGAAAAWPLVARAQTANKLPVIGFLGANTPATQGPWTAVFFHRLRELGWVEGRTMSVEYRWAEGRRERADELAAEFVRLKVDLIFTFGTANVLAAKQATSSIPIVFAAAADPVGTGVVASLAKPGGNITGFSVQQPNLAGKRLEILGEKPAEMSVQQPTKSDLAINLRAAKTLGLTIPKDFCCALTR